MVYVVGNLFAGPKPTPTLAHTFINTRERESTAWKLPVQRHRTMDNKLSGPYIYKKYGFTRTRNKEDTYHDLYGRNPPMRPSLSSFD